MRAVIFKEVGRVAVEDRKLPVIQDPRDAVVKVSVAALCGSDLHWYRGHQKIPTGFIPGHEFAGVVHEIGTQVTGFNVGDAVVVCIPGAWIEYRLNPILIGNFHDAMRRLLLL